MGQSHGVLERCYHESGLSFSIRHLLTVVIVSGEMFDVGALVARAEDFATSLALTALTVLHLQPVASAK